MNDALYNYAQDTENPETNFALALEYEKIGQTASAISFFLRAADRTDDLDFAYECLLHMASCFNAQGNREYTVKGLYQQAISTLPKRPEAYYLYGRYLEWIRQYAESYTICVLGLTSANFETESLRTDLGYPGKYGIIFEKAVVSYWWGKGMESRKLFHELVDNYWDVMNQSHRDMVENNITRLGSGPESQAFTYYYKEDYEKLKFKFNDSDKIERNYSQVYQDMFILSMLNGKKNGTFLEIGGAEPYFGNNTALLEKSFNWSGVSIEYDQKFIENYRNNRSSKLLHTDALQIDYKKLLKENYEGNVIDYLQLDIEPAKNTFECLLSIPFDDYKFAVITYEHDYYVDVTKSYRDKSRRYLKMMGYELVVNDVSPDGISNFEDWWVHPDLVDKDILNIMKDTSKDTKKAKTYMLNLR